MKLAIVVSAVLLAFGAEGAMAACTTNTQVKNGALSTLLSGKTACASRGADKWQEEHRTDLTLFDFKRGPSDKIDPTVKVGTWAVSGTGGNTKVVYTYTTNGSYSYTVHEISAADGTYSFCGTSGTTDNIDLITLKAGVGMGCGF